MNYLKVPNSNVKLTDGNIVMLARFPGTKWVVHNGWYNYAGRRYMGWYFCSIPAQTIIPVNNQDLELLSVVAGEGDASAIPAPPIIDGPDFPGMCPHPGPHPGPFPPGPPGPFPPGPPGPYPPHPPQPDPDGPAFFSKSKDEMLAEAFITVPNIKQRDALIDKYDGKLPDGKIVRVNSVDGIVKYYKWSTYNDRWEDWTDEFLIDYYSKTEVDESISSVSDDITEISDQVASINENIASIQDNVSTLDDKVTELSELVDSRDTSLDDRVDSLEDSVYSIDRIVPTTQNTILVSSDGTLKDSGYSIGDDEIGEPSEYANSTTLATEKAVAKKVEESVAEFAVVWGEF